MQEKVKMGKVHIQYKISRGRQHDSEPHELQSCNLNSSKQQQQVSGKTISHYCGQTFI